MYSRVAFISAVFLVAFNFCSVSGGHFTRPGSPAYDAVPPLPPVAEVPKFDPRYYSDAHFPDDYFQGIRYNDWTVGPNSKRYRPLRTIHFVPYPARYVHFADIMKQHIEVVQYLKDVRRIITERSFKSSVKIVFVIGEEACDLDAVVSAISYAYFQTIHNKEKTILYVPLLNFPGDILWLKKELAAVLLKDILEALMTINEVDNEVLQHDLSEFILIGHYFATTPKILSRKVIGVISSTFFDKRSLPATVKLIINDTAMSNATLIVKTIQKASKVDTSRYLLTILFYSILINTQNLWPGGRAAKLDHEMYQLVVKELVFGEDYIRKQFANLLKAYEDFENLRVYGDRALQKNMDIISTRDAGFRVALAFVPLEINHVMEQNGIGLAMHRLYIDCDSQIVIIIGSGTGTNTARNEIAFIPSNMDDAVVMRIINKLKRRMLIGNRIRIDTMMTPYSGYFYDDVRPAGGFELKQIIQKAILEAEEEFALRLYLQSVRHIALSTELPQDDVKVFMFGANNGSLDSVVSAFSMAYIYDDKSEDELKAEFSMLLGPNGKLPLIHFIPVIGISKQNWILKKEVIDYLDMHTIGTEDCLFAEDLQRLNLSNAKFILVNHNKIEWDKISPKSVVSYVDPDGMVLHDGTKKSHQTTISTTAQIYSTIVAPKLAQIKQYNDNKDKKAPKFKTKIDKYFLDFMHGPIVLNTGNFDMEKGAELVATELAINQSLDIMSRQIYFERMVANKDDAGGLSLTELLHKDVLYTEYGANRFKVAWPYLAISVDEFMLLDVNTRAIDNFVAEHQLSAMILMGRQSQVSLLVFNNFTSKPQVIHDRLLPLLHEIVVKYEQLDMFNNYSDRQWHFYRESGAYVKRAKIIAHFDKSIRSDEHFET